MQALFYAKLYLMTIPIFFALDIVWLGYIGKPFYKKHLAGILGSEVNWTAAVVFYLIYIAGILIFAVIPALEKGSATKALLWGLLFGFFTYATYDLTNMATIKGWPLKIVLVDICWGMGLCTTVAGLSYLIGTRLQ